MVDTILAHSRDEIPSISQARGSSDVPDELEHVFHRLVAKLPEERFQTMDDVIAALQPFAPRLDTACSGIPGAYATLFDRCLALDPETRPTAAEIAGALAKPGAEPPFPVSGGRREEESSTAVAVDGSADVEAETAQASQEQRGLWSH